MAEDQTLEQIRAYLRTLKLRKMEKALDEVLSHGARENLPVSKIIERLEKGRRGCAIRTVVEREGDVVRSPSADEGRGEADPERGDAGQRGRGMGRSSGCGQPHHRGPGDNGDAQRRSSNGRTRSPSAWTRAAKSSSASPTANGSRPRPSSR